MEGRFATKEEVSLEFRSLLDVAHHTLALMEQHGLVQQGWWFEFDNAKRRFGACHRERYGKAGKITLSKHLVKLNLSNTWQINDTILHEIAHALVGRGHGHDYVWMRKAQEIGANPVRCYDSNSVNKVPGNYKAVCSNCGKEFTVYRMPKRSSACKVCCDKYGYGRFSERFVLHYRRIS